MWELLVIEQSVVKNPCKFLKVKYKSVTVSFLPFKKNRDGIDKIYHMAIYMYCTFKKNLIREYEIR